MYSSHATQLHPYLALPWQVVFFLSTSVQRYEEVCTAIAISHGESCGGHLLGGGSCGEKVISFVRGIERCRGFHTACRSIVAMAETNGVFDFVYDCHCVCDVVGRVRDG